MIHVSFQIHDEQGTYCKYLGTALHSLLKSTSETIDVHLLCDNTLKEKDKTALRALAQSYGSRINFYEIKIDDSICKIDECRKWYYSVGTFFRLYLLDVLPDTVSRVITLDPDMIFNLDIKEFWEIAFDGQDIVAVRDMHIQDLDHPLIDKDILSKDQYFNAGAMMMDVATIRSNMNMAKEGVGILRKYYADIVCADQDIFNYLFQHKCKFVDKKYNLSVNILRRKGIQNVSAGIYHYINRAYMSGKFDVYDRLFLKNFCETPWANLDFYHKAFFVLLEKYNKIRDRYFYEKMKLLKKKKIIYFGAESYLNKRIMHYLPPKRSSFFLDNSSTLWGKSFSGLLVKKPDILKNFNRMENYFVMVTSSKYSEIKKQLCDYELVENTDFMWAEHFLSGVEPYEKNGIMTLIDQWEMNDIGQ